MGGGYWKNKIKYNNIGKYIIVGVAAIWDKRKGLYDFFEISKKLSDDYQIILVGLTNSQILKLPSHIIGIGKTNSIQELCILYALSDVFINPTYEDNYPTTNLESISCGTPVITYKTGGSTESAEIFGKTVEKGNIELVIEEIKSCKNYYRNNKFNMDNQDTVKEYLKIYKGK